MMPINPYLLVVTDTRDPELWKRVAKADFPYALLSPHNFTVEFVNQLNPELREFMQNLWECFTDFADAVQKELDEL